MAGQAPFAASHPPQPAAPASTTAAARLLVQQRAATAPPPGLLLIDLPHLRDALSHYFPQMVAKQGGGGLPLSPEADELLSLLLPSVLASLEASYGTHFKKR